MITRATFARAATLIAVASVLAIPAFAAADTITSSIEGSSYPVGSIDNVRDWASTGAAGGYLDHKITDLSSIGPSYPYAYTNAFGSRALRISNGQASGGFGNQTFSPSTSNEAGETTSESLGLSGGERQDMFQASFTIASSRPGVYQPGLYVAASPDRGDGARMGLLRFIETTGGTTVNWADYKAGDPAFTTHPVTTLDDSVPHRVTIKINFYDGPTNDVVTLKIDGTDVTPPEGLTTWEDYSRQYGEPPTVDSLLFRTSLDAGNPTDNAALMGFGYLIDNVSSTTPAVAANGPTGATGDSGATGATGGSGATGATGSNGANGTDGATGTTGATGSTGATGETGAGGPTGPVGSSTPTDPAGDGGSTATAVARIGTGAVIRRGRFFRVPVSCSSSGGAMCVGTVEIRFGRRLIASTGFAIFPGQRLVRLTSVGKILVGARLRVSVVGWSPTGKSTRSSVTRRVK